MDTIRNYLEGMFASLPKSQEVLKAKRELLQMMEDKYNELIEDGKTDNEAVGIVISEFGNLDELAADLGIKEVKEQYETEECHLVDKEEASEYLNAKRRRSFYLALGIFFCIFSIAVPVILEAMGAANLTAAMGLFTVAALGIVTIVMTGVRMKKFDYLFVENARLDFTADRFVKDENDRYASAHALKLTVGVVACALCWLPCVLVDEVVIKNALFSEVLSPVLFFVTVGLGVFLIVQTCSERNGYENLIYLGTKKVMKKQNDDTEYNNEVVDLVMHLFWPTVTAAFLAWSFITFAWYKTWIIWPIAAGVFAVLKAAFRKDEKHE